MGRLLLVVRLALRDLRRRRTEAALLLLAILAATTTLTLGLVMYESGSEPYADTRAATAGPDVIASVGPDGDGAPANRSGLEALTDAPEVVDHSGPFPMVGAELAASGATANVWAQGRPSADAALDRPALTRGRWVRDGGAVVEAGLAYALGIGEGDRITLDGRPFQVVGLAVTAAATPYPHVCFDPCWFGAWEPPDDHPAPPPPDAPAGGRETPAPIHASGLIWLTEADARGLAPDTAAVSYVLNLKLADPAAAPAFVDAHAGAGGGWDGPSLATWQDLLDHHTNLVKNVQLTLLAGSWLIGVLAVASVAVLVGGRMADQTERVGLLKAVGGTPALVAAVLLAEYVLVALLAAAGGLALGRLGAPWLADPGAGLAGSAAPPTITPSRIAVVTAVALGVAVLATLVPAVRAARTSTVSALAGPSRTPRRRKGLIALSARLPVPLLLGVRMAGRRPRRVVLGVISIAITVSGLVAALALRSQLAMKTGADVLELERADQVLLVITVMLIALAAVNAIFLTWATALDARHASALAQALGATAREVSTGLAAAQVLPAFAGAVLGIPGGLVLAAAAHSEDAPVPPLGSSLVVVLGTVVVVAVLTAVPARLGARHPVADVLRGEVA